MEKMKKKLLNCCPSSPSNHLLRLGSLRCLLGSMPAHARPFGSALARQPLRHSKPARRRGGHPSAARQPIHARLHALCDHVDAMPGVHVRAREECVMRCRGSWVHACTHIARSRALRAPTQPAPLAHARPVRCRSQAAARTDPGPTLA